MWRKNIKAKEKRRKVCPVLLVPFLKRHIKLIEAIGLVFALGAWALQWGLTEKMNHAADTFKQLIKEVNNVHIQISRGISTKNEAAITRSLQNNDSLPDDMNAQSIYAWQSPEVRYCWLKEFNNDSDEILHMIEIIFNTEDQYNLKTNPYCGPIKKELNGLRKEVQSNFEIDRAFSNIPIPDPNKIPPEKAFEYSSQISSILHKTEEPINYTIDALIGKKRHHSFIYRMVFGFGSLLLISSKIIEWVYDLRKKEEGSGVF